MQPAKKEMDMKRKLILGLVVGLAGCAPVIPVDPVTGFEDFDISETVLQQTSEDQTGEDQTGGLVERTPDSCGAEPMQAFIGQPQNTAPLMTSERPMRIINPGDLVTQEYNAQRINFTVDATGIILRVACG
ncbi:MAG: hypothetical protein ACJA1F_000890 [Paracoccaceae bacterium]|jgi:hypothetical protein